MLVLAHYIEHYILIIVVVICWFWRTAVPPRLPGSRTDTELSVAVRQRVRMECSPSHGVPEPRITWLKDGEPLESADHTRNIRLLRAGRILQLRSAGVEDSGVYACVIENKAGRDQRRYVLQVNGAPSVSYSDLLSRYLLYSFHPVISRE